MTTETPTAEAVSLATLTAISVRTWLELSNGGEPIPCLMLTYSAPQFDEVDPAVVEATMRPVARSLGAVPVGGPVPDIGARLSISGDVALLWFPETGYGLKIEHSRWVRGLEQAGGALLAIGVDELSPVATIAEVDEYRNNARDAGRLFFALARLGRAVWGGS